MVETGEEQEDPAEEKEKIEVKGYGALNVNNPKKLILTVGFLLLHTYMIMNDREGARKMTLLTSPV